ncbi:solute carrier family 12 member 8 [Trichonephila clavipes]|nr:solute carrier family 12 member 8 [Trichonephila clavipes]
MTTDKDASARSTKSVDWERYGLSAEPSLEKGPLLSSWGEGSSHFHDKGDKELFHEDQGNAGIAQSIGIVCLTVLIGTTTVLSGIGICERCHLESGGVHFLLSHIFGTRTGGAVSLIYCFGQSVSCALHVMGFAESFSQVLDISNTWAIRAVAMGTIILLLAHGVTGYNLENFKNNTGPDYPDNENWFTVFGVFFPAMTGILAGINMSGDLHNPSRDIPVGTLASVGTSFFIYMIFVVGLGGTCQRWALHTDYMIAAKVSAIGVLLLAGLYISAMSACLGALYATPRIIQSMANENVIPIMKFLGKGKGPNKVPIYSLILFASVTFIFVLVGSINTLAPIVTIPFLLTYASVEYAYFSLAMTFDIQKKREERYAEQGLQSPSFVIDHNSGQGRMAYGSTKENKADADLDELFPERVPHHKRGLVREGSSISISATDSPVTSPDEHSSIRSAESRNSQISITQVVDNVAEQGHYESFYDVFSPMDLCIVIFSYSFGLVVLYWPSKSWKFSSCKVMDYDQIIVAPNIPDMEVKEAQLTEDNADYASRKRYHHSKTIESVPHPSHLESD